MKFADVASLNAVRKLVAFNVVNPPADHLSGLPCLERARFGFAWSLPSLGPDCDHAIGREMGFAFLRLLMQPSVAVTPETDPRCTRELLFEFTEAWRNPGHYWASEDHRRGFFECLSACLALALNGDLVLPSFLRRLAALDDQAMAGRCQAILSGRGVEDIFNPTAMSSPTPSSAIPPQKPRPNPLESDDWTRGPE